MKTKKGLFPSVKGLTIAAMLVAMSVIIGIFCKNYLNFGMGLYRVTFENLPIILAGLLFGPAVGGVVGVASDLVSYLLSAQSFPLNPIVTAGACLVGVVSGFVSRYIVKKRGTWQIVASGAAAHIVGSMIVKPIGLFAFYQWGVLWRIPLYCAIAPLEIFVLCLLFKQKSFARLLQDVQ